MQQLALGLLAAIGCGFVVRWMYRNKEKFEVPFLIKFTGDFKNADIRDNKTLSRVGKWERIGEGSYRAQCKISEAKLRQMVEQEYPHIPKKDIIVYNTTNAYAGLYIKLILQR